jgi:hypothetical protein
MRILFLFLLTFISLNVFAQSAYSCDFREICGWNNTTKQIEKCNGIEEASTFRLDAEETEFKHTTATIETTYKIVSREDCKKGSLKVFAVNSNQGNNYTFILDEKQKEIRILTFTGTVIRFKIVKIEKKKSK